MSNTTGDGARDRLKADPRPKCSVDGISSGGIRGLQLAATTSTGSATRYVVVYQAATLSALPDTAFFVRLPCSQDPTGKQSAPFRDGWVAPPSARAPRVSAGELAAAARRVRHQGALHLFAGRDSSTLLRNGRQLTSVCQPSRVGSAASKYEDAEPTPPG
jgi:hypothetical protein